MRFVAGLGRRSGRDTAARERHREEDVSGGRLGRAATGWAPAKKAPAAHKHKTREGNPLRLPPLIFALCETE